MDVYQYAMQLVTEVYKLTTAFPKEEMYGMVSQMRKAAISIPSNIAEGSARRHSREFRQFLYVSLGSAVEPETQIQIARNLEYLSNENYNELINKITQILKILQGLIKSIK
ncbi:ribosomal protein S23 [Melioribacter roseus P3M-2]|uniref:Ribosomal protein S23 n=1 Tax=Melioribacter roseus (strain DSM 23840 / JCM 17771 / VKM B-2668 / P3M-2) TaxID=1191523 RepID=I7A7T2_MELRP|nr:four helix bundle protein [Melioribacter roseus]AFN75906.1 ribosomal protein S23 [Melioribacter roseus P3M-2]